MREYVHTTLVQPIFIALYDNEKSRHPINLVSFDEAGVLSLDG